MKCRIAIWAAAGFLVASGWAVYLLVRSKDHLIELMVYTLIRLTCPVAIVGSHYPRQPLFFSGGKCRHICVNRSSGGNPAAATKPLKLIQDCLLSTLPGGSERNFQSHNPFLLASVTASRRPIPKAGNVLRLSPEWSPWPCHLVTLGLKSESGELLTGRSDRRRLGISSTLR